MILLTLEDDYAAIFCDIVIPIVHSMGPELPVASMVKIALEKKRQ